MKQFVAGDPAIEVNGSTVLSVVDGMGAVKNIALRILWENGIEAPKIDQWYSQQKWLDSFKQLRDKVGPNTLFGIGLAIPDNAEFPPEIDNINKALASIDVAYHMNHRINEEPLFNPNTGQMKEGIGHYTYKKINDNKIEIICDNPYPCEFDKGIVTALSRRFRPKGTKLVIAHDDSKGCRKNGDSSCTYSVSW